MTHAPRLRVAWFSPLPPVRSGIAAYSAEIFPALAADHIIEPFAESNAHDFVWQARRHRFDLVVYQLGNAPCHDYMWAYLVRFPGLVVLHDARLHHARAPRRSRCHIVSAMANRREDVRVVASLPRGRRQPVRMSRWVRPRRNRTRRWFGKPMK